MDEREISPEVMATSQSRYKKLLNNPDFGKSASLQSQTHGVALAEFGRNVPRVLVGLIGIAIWVALIAFLISLVVWRLREDGISLGGIVPLLFGLVLVGGCFVLVFGTLATWLIQQSGWPPAAKLLRSARGLLRIRTGSYVSDDDWDAIDSRYGTEYIAYLQSPEWKERRALLLQKYHHRCQVCNGVQQLQLHHRTYERLGNEHMEDLTVLCRECHTAFHENRGMPVR